VYTVLQIFIQVTRRNACGASRPLGFWAAPPEVGERQMPLEMTNRDVDGVTVLTLDGRVVFGQEAGALRDKVKSLIDTGKKNLVLNIDKITFIDSAGLGALVTAHNSVNSHGGALHLCQMAPKFKEMLRMTRMDSVFRVFDSESEAVQGFSK